MVLIVVSLFVLFLLVTYIGIDSIMITLSKLSIEAVCVYILLSFLIILLFSLRTFYLLKSIGYNTSVNTLLLVISSSLLLSNITPGRIGELVKPYLLKKKLSIPQSKGLALVVFERVYDMISLLLFSSIGLLLLIGEGISGEIAYLAVGTLLIFILIILALIFSLLNKSFAKRIYSFVSHFLKKLPILNKRLEGVDNSITKISLSFYSAVALFSKDRENIIKMFLISIVVLLLDALRIYYVLDFLGIHLSYLVIISMNSLSILMGIISTLPGGIGSMETSATVLFSYFGTETRLIGSGIIIVRSMQYAFLMLVGVISFLILKIKIPSPEAMEIE